MAPLVPCLNAGGVGLRDLGQRHLKPKGGSRAPVVGVKDRGECAAAPKGPRHDAGEKLTEPEPKPCALVGARAREEA